MHPNFFLEALKQRTRVPHLPRRHSRLQARPQRERPVAVCTRCSAFSFSTGVIDQACDRNLADTACPGKYASAVARNVWQKCPTCEATGWQSRMVCSHCQSLGWLRSVNH